MEEQNSAIVIDSPGASLPPEKVRVLGAGHFGQLAVERLTRRFPHADFLVVDAEEERLDPIRKGYGIAIRVEDAMLSLENDPVEEDTWVVPAVPVHVAFQWLLGELNHSVVSRSLPVPDEIDGQIPNPYRVADGTVYASFATFICPDTCNEPDEMCTHTKEPRPGNLFDVLSAMAAPGFRAVVLRSLQLAPGVGGYTGGQLKSLLDFVARYEGNYLIATSCRCHGVINGLNWSRGSRGPG